MLLKLIWAYLWFNVISYLSGRVAPLKGELEYIKSASHNAITHLIGPAGVIGPNMILLTLALIFCSI